MTIVRVCRWHPTRRGKDTTLTGKMKTQTGRKGPVNDDDGAVTAAVTLLIKSHPL